MKPIRTRILGFYFRKINEKEEKRRIIPLFWLKSAIVSTSVAAGFIDKLFLFNDKIDSNLPKTTLKSLIKVLKFRIKKLQKTTYIIIQK